MRWLWALVAALLLVATSGCDDAAAPVDNDGSTESESCQDYVQGIEQATDSGSYTVSILDANPAPPDRGMNDLVLRVVDVDGAPVDSGVVLVVEPWMPAHGHGSTNVTAVPRGADGVYDANQVNLIMPGAWEFRMLITPDMVDAKEDSAVFTFCAEG